MINPIGGQPNVGQINSNPDNIVRDNFESSTSKVKNIQENSQEVADVFQPNQNKEEIIKQIDELIKQKENELKQIDEEIRKYQNPTSIGNAFLDNNRQIVDQIKIETLNMQKVALQNQIQVLQQRKQQVENEEKQKEMKIEEAVQSLKNNYQISIDQLNNLKKQVEAYQSSMNTNYKKQIEALNNEIVRLQKEIEDLFNQHPSNPEEAEQIAQKIAEKRNLISVLKGQIDLLSQEISNLNNQINQQIGELDRQIGDIRKQMNVDFYNKWAMGQAIRREIEQIIWTELMNEKNHVANLWKMYFDTNSKINAMWREMYLKKVADNSSFAAQWAKAIGA